MPLDESKVEYVMRARAKSMSNDGVTLGTEWKYYQDMNVAREESFEQITIFPN